LRACSRSLTFDLVSGAITTSSTLWKPVSLRVIVLERSLWMNGGQSCGQNQGQVYGQISAM
jgi:hypothetical protein